MSAARLHKRAVKKAAKKSAKVVAKKTAAKKAAVKVRAYRHQEKRTNIPHAGIAHKNSKTSASAAVASANDAPAVAQPSQYDHHLHPQLLWAGRQEQPAANVPIQPLHVHERVDPAVIIRATLRKNGNGQPPLFESPDEKLTLKQELEFYQHDRNWANRLIAGDSLIIMNSLLKKEAMAGKVQCVYMDPPYGIKYGSNFQPFVNKRDVKDGDDKDLTTEPEMIRAFRDTWELGIHSYLSYLRDRLALSHELLADSGSCFVQISDENVHLVRCIMDEIFGAKNFCSVIDYVTTSTQTLSLLPSVSDKIIWYAKNKDEVKYRQLFLEKQIGGEGAKGYSWIESPDGKQEKRLSREELKDPSLIPNGWIVFSPGDLTSSHESKSEPYSFQGREYNSGRRFWSTHAEGLRRLEESKRLIAIGNSLRYKRRFDDFPVYPLNNFWGDTGVAGFTSDRKHYVVQTNPKVIQRCVLMATDPGDLVFDPTCGGGTTAYVAEQWGRRWITCDTSRVALTLARQRLMTARFDYYKLQDDKAGIRDGFVCKTVPHITLKSIANNLSPDTETLHDQPEVDKTRARVMGPFTVEAVPSPVVKSPDDFSDETFPQDTDFRESPPGSEESRRGGTARHDEWCRELRASGLQGKGGRVMEIEDIGPYSADTLFLHARFMVRGTGETGFVSFGEEHSPLSARQVNLALVEMENQRPRRSLLVFAAFEFDPEAARDVDEAQWEGVTVLKAKMSPDLQTGDLRRGRSGESSFWLMGRPDAELRRLESGEDKGKWVAEVHGFDYYDPVSGEMRSGESDAIAMWMLDPDYDGRSVYPRQVFFPMSAGQAMWRKLARNLQAEVDADLMEKFTGRVSLPFEVESGESRLVAVKIIDNRGIESVRVLRAQG